MTFDVGIGSSFSLFDTAWALLYGVRLHKPKNCTKHVYCLVLNSRFFC